MFIKCANVCFIRVKFVSVSFMDLFNDWFANNYLIGLKNNPEFRQFSFYFKTLEFSEKL
jgi:hypothetical protein